MKQALKKITYAMSKGPLRPLLCGTWNALFWTQLQFLKLCWFFRGARKPNKAQQDFMRENVTFLYKSFERQRLAKRLYRNIQHYYPGIRVIIADDSKKPLALSGPGLQVIQLPYNVGLSVGLNQGLAKVETPFVIRMDDDELLTPCANYHRQLQFLMDHPEVDLVGILPLSVPVRKNWKNKQFKQYAQLAMSNAPKALKIPHLTWLDETHVVLGKIPNIFIARTDKYRSIGYDDNIRMIDHHEFFFRAAGNLVSVLDTSCFVIHNHCPFDYPYHVHRYNIADDKRYIAMKHAAYFHISSQKQAAKEDGNN